MAILSQFDNLHLLLNSLESPSSNNYVYTLNKSKSIWKSETEFVNDFLNAFGRNNESTFILKEFRTGYGLTDILLIEYDRDIVTRRKENLEYSELKSFNNKCGYAMTYLSEKHSVKLDDLKAFFNSSSVSIRMILENLMNRGLIEKDGDMINCSPKNKIFAIKSIIAIEAKLKNWKRAIFQAQRYLWFTSNSNILYPETNIMQLDKIRYDCEKFQVGLITFSENKTISNVVRIKKDELYNTYLTWLLNEFLLGEIENERERIQS